MARKASTAKAAEAVEVKEVKEEAVVAEAPAAPEKAEAPKKKTTKTAEKKTTKTTAAKKPAAKKTAKADTQANIFIQYQGVELSYADLIERAKAEADVKSPKNVNIYVKPEENMVYYVVDEKVGGFQLA